LRSVRKRASSSKSIANLTKRWSNLVKQHICRNDH
jgi:hypothetical protein